MDERSDVESVQGKRNICNNTGDVQRLYITEMLKQHEEFILIGLTGRVGSGCSDVASILCSSFSEINLPPIYPGNVGLEDDVERDKRILYRYAAHHWQKFDVIRVRAIITSFMLNNLISFFRELAPYIRSQHEKTLDTKKKFLSSTLEYLRANSPSNDVFVEKFNHIQNTLNRCRVCKIDNINFDPSKYIDEINDMIYSWREADAKNLTELSLSKKLFETLYKIAEDSMNYNKRAALLEEIDDLLNCFSAFAAMKWWETEIGTTDELKERDINKKLRQLSKIDELLTSWTKVDNLHFSKYVFVHNIIPALSDSLHEIISKSGSLLFTELYQKYGNSIRRYGKVVFDNDNIDRGCIDSIGYYAFAIPRRINQFVKSIRHPFSREFAKPTRIVVDSIKSPLEASYLKERYSAFYLFAISAEDNVIVDRLTKRKNLTLREINCINWSEYSNYGAQIYQRFSDLKRKMSGLDDNTFFDFIQKENYFNHDEIAFIKKIDGENIDGQLQIFDSVRKEAYQNKLNQFVLQDVSSSIQNADVFISNNHRDETQNLELKWEIVRNISLVSYPGLLLPTEIERCMQVAFTAKANSGCLSRQVGAVVTDPEYNILSIGWNDVPCGDIKCSRKNLVDIYNLWDTKAYSDYELSNDDFKNRIKEKYDSVATNQDVSVSEILCGLPWRYCFKDIHADGKHPMRSRAMHAEEKALANIQEKAAGGFLFTTSSPCEMCSKNAKNHRIKKIFYIEPYPGISEEQYSKSGSLDNRAEHILFTGAIGRAYMQMYTPIMPQKDILGFLGL